MKIVTHKGIVIDYSETVEFVPNGILVGDYIIGIPVDNGGFIPGHEYEIHEVDSVPSDFVPNKYKFSNGEFSVNQEREDSITQKIQQAIDDYTLELIEGGLL